MSDDEPSLDAALASAARAVYGRYQREIVEGFDFCPYAKQAREQGAVRVEVCCDAQPTHGAVLAVADELAADERVEIGLLLFPRVFVDRFEWQRFVGEVHDLDAKSPRPMAKQFAAAAFHPDAEPDTGSPARLVSFVRRTPDPSIQFVRISVLARMRARDPKETTYVAPDELDGFIKRLSEAPLEQRLPLHERIARANLETVRERGVAYVRGLLDAILRERDERYAALGEATRRRERATGDGVQ
jgi:hypothetical protein